MTKSKFILLSGVIFLSACGGANPRSGAIDIAHPKEAWNSNNDPVRLRSHYEVKLAKLPTAAELQRKPWSDSYWPSYKGGIADRWNDPSNPNSFKYPLYEGHQLSSMSAETLKTLSPAEKYDLLQGRLDYPLVKEERNRTSPNDPAWYGLCHGWAPAAINYDEPKPVVMRSPLGFDIPFGSSDVKALLIFAQQNGGQSRMLGERCNFDIDKDPGHANDPACRDTNAGSFHVIVANQIGLLQEGFVADVARDIQVWNQPVFGYQSTISRESVAIYPHAARGTAKIVKVQTTLRYIGEIGANWEPKPFAEFPYQEVTRNLSYYLELNQSGDIIGGEWISNDRPDFLWTQTRAAFTGYFQGISALYQASIRGR